MFATSYIPQTRSNPRDKYIAALAQLKQAEAEYLAAEALEQEERALRLRLQELEIQKRLISGSAYASSPFDTLTLLRRQVEDEECRRAATCEEAIAACERQRLYRQLLEEKRRNEEFDARKTLLEQFSRHSGHTKAVNVEDILSIFPDAQPTSLPEKRTSPTPQEKARPLAVALQEIFTRASDKFGVPSFPHSTSLTRSYPVKASPADEPSPSRLDATLPDVLKVFWPAVTALQGKAASVGPIAQPVETLKSPKPETGSKDPDSISSLKQHLEERLNGERANEIKDTIQAIFASLAEHQPSTTTSAPSAPESSFKGKEKVSSTPQTDSVPTFLDVFASHRAIQKIDIAFRTLVDDFTFPSQLDFTPLSSPTSSETESKLSSRLSYTSRNAPLRYYEQSLSGLLAQLDEVQSFGNDDLRKERKEVVDRVEAALEELEREVEGRWSVKNVRERKEKEQVDGSVQEESASVASDPLKFVATEATTQNTSSTILDNDQVPSELPNTITHDAPLAPATATTVEHGTPAHTLEQTVLPSEDPLTANSVPATQQVDLPPSVVTSKEAAEVESDADATAVVAEELVTDEHSDVTDRLSVSPSSSYPPAPATPGDADHTLEQDDHDGSDWSEVEA